MPEGVSVSDKDADGESDCDLDSVAVVVSVSEVSPDSDHWLREGVTVNVGVQVALRDEV